MCVLTKVACDTTKLRFEMGHAPVGRQDAYVILLIPVEAIIRSGDIPVPGKVGGAISARLIL